MPKRTNTFQELVALLQQTMAVSGSIVTQSAELMVGGQLREIDVLVTVDTGISRVKIAVEAKDHKRKLDVTHVEALIGKYRNPDGIPVNQVILVARKGFTKTAIDRAKQVGMRLFTLDQAIQSDWPKTFGLPAKQKISFRMSPRITGVEIRPRVDGVNQQQIADAKVLCASCGRLCGDLKSYANHLMDKHLSNSQKQAIGEQFKAAIEKGQQGLLCNRVTFKMDKKKLVIGDEEHNLNEVIVHVHAKNEESDLEFSYYDYISTDGESHQVHHGKASFHDSNFEILMPDGTKSKNITIRIGDSC